MFPPSSDITVPVQSQGRPEWIFSGRVPCLDGLRAVSILLVMVEHASLMAAFRVSSVELNLGHIGYIGVSMFFALSGFLITLLLVREWNVTTAISLGGFYRRRAYRILPAYLTFLLAVFVLTRVHVVTLTHADWRGALTYTTNFVTNPTWEVGHLWSLSVEEQFYLVWPVLFLALRPSKAMAAIVTYMVGVPILRTALWLLSPDTLARLDAMTPLRLDAIAGGCLLALLATRPQLPALLVRLQRHPERWAAAAVAVLMISFPSGQTFWGYRVTLRYGVDALALITLIWSLAHASRSRVGRVLEARPVAFLGVLSYSLYLWQQLLLTPRQAHGIVAWTSHVVLAVVLAALSYYAIERPFLRLRDPLRARARFSSGSRAAVRSSTVR